MSVLILAASAFSIYHNLALASKHEDSLISRSFKNYQALVRPTEKINCTPTIVYFGLTMTFLINVDEKNQVMHSNVWLMIKWQDYRLSWDPREFGNILSIRLPPDKVWLPDIVLFNKCADGNYKVSYESNVVVDHRGEVLWVPPAIYKSSCAINVQYFPFDQQICKMVFGSWTYNNKEVVLNFMDDRHEIELNDYSPSDVWEIMAVPGFTSMGSSKIIFCVQIRRKSLFYTIILIVPTALMAFLNTLVFYLPADSCEKLTLATSILLALVVFMLLVSRILPPVSSTVPMIAAYLLMTFFINILTILATVVTIKIFFHGQLTQRRVPTWFRRFFLHLLARLLLVKIPHENNDRKLQNHSANHIKSKTSVESFPAVVTTNHRKNPWILREAGPVGYPHRRVAPLMRKTPIAQFHPHGSQKFHSSVNTTYGSTETTEAIDHKIFWGMTEEAEKAVQAIDCITGHFTAQEKKRLIREEWQSLSQVLDRLLLYVVFGMTASNTLRMVFVTT